MKWFDLKSVGGRLDRVEETQGHFILALSIDAERLERSDPETVERLGWISRGRDNDRMTFHNLRPVHRATDVAQALQAFYPEETIRDVYTDKENLTQGEKIEGLRTRASAKISDFEQEMQGVDPEDLQRIRGSILRAQEAVQKMSAESGKQPLDGRGFEFVSKMNEVGEAELGVAAVLTVGRGHVNPAIERLIVELADNDAKDASKIERLRDLIPSNVVRKVGIACDIREQKMKETSTEPVPRFRAMIDPLRSEVSVSVLEPFRRPKENATHLEGRLGMKVRRDKSLSTAQYIHTIAAVSKAMGAISEALNRDTQSVVPNQKDVVLRISRKSVSTNAGVMGSQVSLGNDEDEGGKALAIRISANSGSAFVHEFGHLIDQAYGVSPEERRDLLEKTGVRGRIVRQVTHDVEEGVIEPEYAEYLSSDAEIWARTFEAAIANRSVQDGDLTLDRIGGFVAAFPSDHYAPIGDNQVTEKFLRSLNELIEEKLTASFEKRPVSAVVEP
jgi:hypothetical protein